MITANVPPRDEVSAGNQAVFDQLQKRLGFVPNLDATFAHSEQALGSCLAVQNAKPSIRDKAREVVHLVVSQVNDCGYCLVAHTAIGGMVGFKPEQILEIRSGRATWDAKLDALAPLAHNIAINRGHADQALVDAVFAAGWTKEHLVDAIVVIGDKVVTNYLHATTRVPVDFPAAPKLTTRVAAAA